VDGDDGHLDIVANPSRRRLRYRCNDAHISAIATPSDRDRISSVLNDRSFRLATIPTPTVCPATTTPNNVVDAGDISLWRSIWASRSRFQRKHARQRNAIRLTPSGERTSAEHRPEWLRQPFQAKSPSPPRKRSSATLVAIVVLFNHPAEVAVSVISRATHSGSAEKIFTCDINGWSFQRHSTILQCQSLYRFLSAAIFSENFIMTVEDFFSYFCRT